MLSNKSRAILERTPAKSIPLITGKMHHHRCCKIFNKHKTLVAFPCQHCAFSTEQLNLAGRKRSKVVEESHLPAGRLRGLQELSSPSPPQNHQRSLWERAYVRNVAWRVERGRGQGRTAHWDTVDEWETTLSLHVDLVGS